jgi:IMP dehydrogenase
MSLSNVTEGLTFDDVLLVPQHSAVIPRFANPVTRLAPELKLPLPIMSAAMDTVTEAPLAITMACLGGMGIIHKNMSIEDEAKAVRLVKAADPIEGNVPAVGKDGRLLVGAAVSVGEIDRAANLVEAGVNLLAVDSAHGHSTAVIETVKELKGKFDIPVMAGNVATGQAVKDLAEAGAAIVKVGVGPGSICTTRIVAGVGVPQLTALIWACNAARQVGVSIVADGGIRYSGDCVKALAAGAQAVMIGRLFSGTDEAPGRKVMIEGRIYKSYRGMGSVEAMSHGSASRYGQDCDDEPAKLVPEGVEAVVPSKGPLERVLYQFSGGLKAGMGYLGASSLSELAERAQFVRQTQSGFRESHPHSLAQYSEAPNYEGL